MSDSAPYLSIIISAEIYRNWHHYRPSFLALCHLHALHMTNRYHQSSWSTRCMHRQRVSRLCSLPQPPCQRGTLTFQVPGYQSSRPLVPEKARRLTVMVAEMLEAKPWHGVFRYPPSHWQISAVPFCIQNDWDTRLGRAAVHYIIR